MKAAHSSCSLGNNLAPCYADTCESEGIAPCILDVSTKRELGDQLHTAAILLPGKEHLAPIGLMLIRFCINHSKCLQTMYSKYFQVTKSCVNWQNVCSGAHVV